MIGHQIRRFETVSLSLGAFALLVTGCANALFVMSWSNPWLIGVQNEPHWSWAIGSGRLKIWVAEPGHSSEYDWWTNSWYRGLDGQSIRWDFTIDRGTTGGVIVLAIPFWAISTLSGICGTFLIMNGLKSRLTADPVAGHRLFKKLKSL